MDAKLEFIRSQHCWRDRLYSSHSVAERRIYARKKTAKNRMIIVFPCYELERSHATPQIDEEPTKERIVYEEKCFSKHVVEHFSKIPIVKKISFNETIWCSYCPSRTKLGIEGVEEELFDVSSHKLIKFPDIPITSPLHTAVRIFS